MDQPAQEQEQPVECEEKCLALKPSRREPARRRSARTPTEAVGADARFVSVKTLARQWDCSRTTVSRLLEQAGVRTFYFGRGRNGSKRYLRTDVEEFLSRLETA